MREQSSKKRRKEKSKDLAIGGWFVGSLSEPERAQPR